MEDHLSKFIDAMSAAGCSPANSSEVFDGVDNKLIKAADDRGKSKTLYVSFRAEGDKAFGRWYSCKHANGDSWFSRSHKEWTAEEKAAWAERRKAERDARDKELQQGYEDVALAAQELWRGAKRADEHPYLTKKGIKGTGCRVHGGDLLIPLRDIEGKLWLLQTITSEGDKFNSFRLPDGTWASGGKKQGCYHGVVNGKTDKGVIVIAEGFATGRSIAEATGLAVVCAVDSTNLKPVAEAIRKKYPDAAIVIGADNDQWTFKTPRPSKVKGIKREETSGDDVRWSEWRSAEYLHNPGIEKGGQAAAKVDGFIVYPDVPENDPDKRTDFNDIEPDDVKRIFGDVIAKIEENRNKPPPEPSKPPDYDIPTSAYEGDARLHPGLSAADEDSIGDLGLPLRVLGQNNGKYYYFPFSKQQIVSLSASAHTLTNLFQLCDLETWKMRIGSDVSDNRIPTLAANMLMKAAHDKGVFEEDGSVRGCGAWTDAGRIVIHCGNKVYVDGVAQKPKDVYGKYVYVSSVNVLDVEQDPLPNEEAIKLRKICSMPTWEMELSGVLLAGWLVIAPVCGALDWRPHIWVVGESSSGKSTIINKIVRPVLDKASINVDGLTTEPAIRQMMGYSARPVVFDEGNAKAGNNIGSNMDGIIMLSRLASSGGIIGKYGQNVASFRSCFCFGAVNPPISSLQDETRQTMMALRKNTAPNAQQQYDDLLAIIHETLTPQFAKRLLARTMANLPTLLKNIRTFQHAARSVINDARAADQISAMLGGFYMLHHTDEIPKDEALKIVAEYSWTEHTTITAKSDPERLLQHICTSLVRVPSLQKDVTMGTMIYCALGHDTTVLRDTAREILKNYSIKVEDNYNKKKGIFIGANNQNMRKLLSGTEWMNGYKKMLQALPMCEDESCVYFGVGDRQRAVRIPLEYFESSDEKTQIALPMEEEDTGIPF